MKETKQNNKETKKKIKNEIGVTRIAPDRDALRVCSFNHCPKGRGTQFNSQFSLICHGISALFRVIF